MEYMEFLDIIFGATRRATEGSNHIYDTLNIMEIYSYSKITSLQFNTITPP